MEPKTTEKIAEGPVKKNDIREVRSIK